MKLSTAEERLSKEFGAAIRNRRKTLGYTQEELADMIGSNRRFISELERGKGTSYLGPALAAAETLGLQISRMLSEKKIGSGLNLPPFNGVR
ncbi:helix-turn-helix domain-containing protein [Ochrobactrum quorumnocens]|uniref:helix-turn-helix domain-containing protein n=1 Tax=Ochrobactrum quorumnocens TaxID=271865 RepID=UPI000B05F9EB|nr:helix-turn-helix domain-containing protein [[Ochrobactrum] quorumnocens]